MTRVKRIELKAQRARDLARRAACESCRRRPAVLRVALPGAAPFTVCAGCAPTGLGPVPVQRREVA